ncbi:MAG: homoserine O-succinyltransferase [Eubacteriales bacterium]
MPIIISEKLPAYSTLKKENVFVMKDLRAQTQDIRPLKIAVVNLMPKKIETETQLIRMLANTPLQVELKLVHMESHKTKNTKGDHLNNFYKTFDDIKKEKFDGMIITGAPVETIPYQDVDYWEEFKEILDFTKTNVFSTLHLCWGAQGALYHHYGVKRHFLEKKLFGVFSHKVIEPTSRLMRGFDDEFYAPHSRHTQILEEELKKVPNLEILAKSEEAGIHIASTENMRQIFIQGHGEYDRETLKNEYLRDSKKGENIQIPKNYFIDDDPKKDIRIKWRGHSNLLFSNWLNYCVYQETPYNLEDLKE